MRIVQLTEEVEKSFNALIAFALQGAHIQAYPHVKVVESAIKQLEEPKIENV